MSILLEKLIDFYKEDPSDPFNIYALAIEYAKFDTQKAKIYFNELLTNHPAYIPTYYHAAALFSQLHEPDLAKMTYEKGIEMAEKLNKMHALRELKSAYLNFLDDQFD